MLRSSTMLHRIILTLILGQFCCSAAGRAQDLDQNAILEALQNITDQLERFDERIEALEGQSENSVSASSPQYEQGLRVSVYGGSESVLPAGGPGELSHFITFPTRALIPFRFSDFKRNADAASYADRLGGLQWEGFFHIKEAGSYDIQLQPQVDYENFRGHGGTCLAQVNFGGSSVQNLFTVRPHREPQSVETQIDFDEIGYYQFSVWISCGSGTIHGKTLYPNKRVQDEAAISIQWKKEGEHRYQTIPARSIVREVK